MVPNISILFKKLELSIDLKKNQQLFGEEFPAHYRYRVSVTVKQDGTIIPKLKEMVDRNYQASMCECSYLLDSVKGNQKIGSVFHSETLKEVRVEIRRKKVKISEILQGKIKKRKGLGDWTISGMKGQGRG